VGTAHAGCGSLTLFAIRVLADHPHAVWSLPAGDRDFSTRWQRIKSAFSARIPAAAQRKQAAQTPKGHLAEAFLGTPNS
jgi:REP element-mobilizing transposase RayT